MAMSYVGKATAAKSASATVSLAVTIPDDVAVLVITVVTEGSSLNGFPDGYPYLSINGVAQSSTIVRSETQYSSSPENAVAMFYIVAPNRGTGNVVLLNNNLKMIWLACSWYKGATFKKKAALDTDNAGTGAAANPSVSVTTGTASAVVAVLGDGYASVPTGRTGTSLHTLDFGADVGAVQYTIQGAAGATAMGFTISSDDYQEVVGAWKEADRTTEAQAVASVAAAGLGKILGMAYSTAMKRLAGAYCFG